MKKLRLLLVLAVFTLTSCDTVLVASDYDEAADFTGYKTYAYFKDGIDRADISDLDKKRILRAIDAEMAKKGYTKVEKADLLINIFTKARQEVNVNTFNSGWGYGWGWGWNPWMWGGNYTSVSTATEGTLYIDMIDAAKKEMIWQGVGAGVITQDREEKQDRINEFVTKILAQFPPEKFKK